MIVQPSDQIGINLFPVDLIEHFVAAARVKFYLHIFAARCAEHVRHMVHAFSLTAHGVLVTRRPMERSVFKQLLDSMCSVRERLRGMRKKTMTLEEKMEEIRLVNRAKWALIESRGMSEEEAHRYIQKLSMDMCLSKKETAENILRGRL